MTADQPPPTSSAHPPPAGVSAGPITSTWDSLDDSGVGEDCADRSRGCADCLSPNADLGFIGSDAWGYSISGNLGTDGKWYASFSGLAGKVYWFDLCDQGSANINVDLKICDVNCAILDGVDGDGFCGYKPNNWSWTCPADGTYYVVIAPGGSWNQHACLGQAGHLFTLSYYSAAGGPCDVVCPPGGLVENEPNCRNVNDGCNQNPAAFTDISCGQTVCGTASWNGTRRDTDWYRLVVADDTQITVRVNTDFPAIAGIIQNCGIDDCEASSGYLDPFVVMGACDAIPVTVCVPAGTWWLFVGADFEGDPFACGAEYTITVDCAPCTPQRGACCLRDGTCVPALTACRCQDDGPAGIGGVWWGDGSTCGTDPCPPPLECGTYSQFSAPPYLSSDGWAAVISDQANGDLAGDTYSADAPVCGVSWWGTNSLTDLVFWYSCFKYPDQFLISFHEDAGGVPDAASVCEYTVTPTKVDSGFEYLLDPSYMPLYQYTAELSPCCELTEGWIAIQGVDAGQNCWFVWMGSPYGDGQSVLNGQVQHTDLGVCLMQGPMPGDLNTDGTIDLNDVPQFVSCLAGPDVPPPSYEMCRLADFDEDGDVDAPDFGAFQRDFGSSLDVGIGACCNPDGTCSDNVWAYECTGGAVYLGDAVTCGASVCPTFGACCDGGVDGTCRDLTGNQCNAEGDIYQGDGTDCATSACPFGRYSNETSPITAAIVGGTAQRLADDLTLAGAGARDLVFYDLAVFGGGGGTFDVTVSLYDGCPGSGGVVIPATTVAWADIPDDGDAYLLRGDLSAAPVTIPDTVWMVANFSTPEAAWLVAEEAEVGSTANVYGWDDPWNCAAVVPGHHAGFWADLRCRAGGSGSDSRSEDEPVQRVFRLELQEVPLSVSPGG